MIDIHCHPLPEVDDGAKSFEIAVAMCRMAAESGTTHLVATPHCNYRYEFNPESNHAKLAELQAAVGAVPKLLLGCDFHLSYENIQRLSGCTTDFTINGTSYLLVEFADQFVPEQLDNVFYEIEVAGLTPILTHPERNATFQRRPDLLHHWVLRGCLVQITAMAYLGRFGSRAQDLAEEWLDQNLVHFFASDAHDLARRPPTLDACYAKVAKVRGKETADLLLKKNAEAVINGIALPSPPQPREPGNALKNNRTKRWFSFLWR